MSIASSDNVVAPASRGDAEIALDLRALSLWYGARRALDAVSFGVPARRITALVGPSGSGKSSLLRCLNRLNDEHAECRVEGDVLLAGTSIYGDGIAVHDLRRRVGMVFQRPNPFPLSIRENVAYGPRLVGVRGRALDEIVESALRTAGLRDEVSARLDESALALSLGQQQRLVIARALAVGPEILLMDEPASALDAAATLRLEELLRELAKRYTVLLVTHNMQQAARVSDCIAFLHEGRLVEFGETDALLTNPRE
ncbi:MAG TPA: phosphate ABC transporter ATP-binding protein, partial [Rhodanobacteraceae bacterium]|nr:phosphate ABC transporter ATP-binding protein [Rhodanobacteraceae bacterium]